MGGGGGDQLVTVLFKVHAHRRFMNVMQRYLHQQNGPSFNFTFTYTCTTGKYFTSDELFHISICMIPSTQNTTDTFAPQ